MAPNCRLFNTCCSSVGNHGELLLDYFGWLIHDSVQIGVLESKFWDPRLPEGLQLMALSKSSADFHWDPGASYFLKFTRFEVDLGLGADVHWDPRSVEGLQSIVFIRLSADSASASVYLFLIMLLMQRKCGGYTGRDIHYLVLMSAQWHFSVLSFSGSSLGCMVFKLFPTAVMWCIKDMMFIWILS
jgi:hypothetical protein